MSISPTLMIFPIILLVFLVIVVVSFRKFGFRSASYGLFGIGLAGTLFSLFILPLIFPWMSEGMGIGLIIAPIALPLLSILGIINVVIAVRRFFQKIATKGDYVFLALAGLMLLLTVLMIAELWG